MPVVQRLSPAKNTQSDGHDAVVIPIGRRSGAGARPVDPRHRPRRWLLNPAARVLWRGPDVVQLELGATAIVLEGVDADTVRGLLPGPAGDASPVADEIATGREAVLDVLAEHGFLWPADSRSRHRLHPPTPRLAPELAALSSRYGAAAADLLRARRRAAVAIHGTGRIAAHVAALLAAAGVGRLHVVADGRARLQHSLPGGIGPHDEGAEFTDAVTAAVRRAAPDVDTTPLPIGERPDLVVLAVDEPVDDDTRDALHARRCSHLAVGLGAGRGVVGPLVVPGRTSCLRCADLHRRDRDPAWTALAVQLAMPRRPGPAADVALATVTGGLAAAEALAFLDGGDPPTVNGTVEMHVPDWRLRRRTWLPHGACDCGAGRSAE